MSWLADEGPTEDPWIRGSVEHASTKPLWEVLPGSKDGERFEFVDGLDIALATSIIRPEPFAACARGLNEQAW